METELWVDAGHIGAIAYEKSERKEYAGHVAMLFDMGRAGTYKVRIIVKDCWLGRRQKTAKIKTESGKILVGDLGYQFDDGWDDYLKETDYTKKPTEYSFAVNTGGDGSFKVEASVWPENI